MKLVTMSLSVRFLQKRCSIVKHFKSHKPACKLLKGFYIVAINDRPFFDKDGIIDCLSTILNENAIDFEIAVPFDQRLLANNHWRNC